MKIKLNSEEIETECPTLRCLRKHFFPEGEIITIVNGWQTSEDRSLKEGDVVTLIERGKMPDEKSLEAMMTARHTPGVLERLKTARVGVAGIGGLGSQIALALARTGVGCLHLVDFDIVEPSNLNRQAYQICHLGKAKTMALKEEIKAVNPFIEVKTDNIYVDANNAATVFAKDEVVCEAFDNPEAKATLINSLLTHCSDTVVIAASGMAGYASGNSIQTRRINHRFYLCGDGETEACEGQGLMAPRVMICAGHQANTVIRVLLGEK